MIPELPQYKPSDLRYFKPREFRCRCDEDKYGNKVPGKGYNCGLNDEDGIKGMDPRALAFHDELRHRTKVQHIYSNFCRCPQHNADVGGKPGSEHLVLFDEDEAHNKLATAGDLLKTDEVMGRRGVLINAVLNLGGTIAEYDNFFHIDLKPRQFWLYDARSGNWVGINARD